MSWTIRILLCIATLLTAFSVRADSISLLDSANIAEGWRFDNGREFPGATGELAVDPGGGLYGEDCLKLIGDFTGGGGYVQAMRRFEPVEIESLSFQMKAEGAERFTMRIGDESGQTHQIDIGVDPEADWQKIEFPLRRFFESRGTAEAVTNILRYQSWGGAGDGKWHGAATYVCFLLGNGGRNSVRTIWLQDLGLDLAPQPIEGAGVTQSVFLSETFEGLHEWKFTNGPEFKGATGNLSVMEAAEGGSVFELSGDFTEGGAYCGVSRSLSEFNVEDLAAIRMQVRTENATSITVRLSDNTGQAHQRRGYKIRADGAWNELLIDPTRIAGGEHWGGANDGKWHGPATNFFLSLTNGSDPEKKPTLQFRNVTAEMVVPVFSEQPVLTESFDAATIQDGWSIEGNVRVSESDQSLEMIRPLEDIEKPTSVETSPFAIEFGQWLVKLRSRSDLHSPDNSYRVAVSMVCLDSSNQTIESIPILDITGNGEWANQQDAIAVPSGAKTAKLKIHFEKTYGKVEIDSLSVSPLSPAPLTESKVDRILFSSNQLGNLLFPDDSRNFWVEVICRKPLSGTEKSLNWFVCDYWGNEQADPGIVEMGTPEKTDRGFLYRAEINCGDLPLELGRYYELHASLPSTNGDSPTNHTGFAILPEAATHQYKPDEVPFTARNWDNRVEAYIRLTHRLGVRICGLWGGWSSKPPYEAKVPGLDLVKELGMGWLTNTPAAQIERGSTDYTPEALEKGVTNLLENFGDYRPMIVNLGNEPHGTGDRVLKNVEAYKTLYQTIKAFDPDLPVVATSVEPNEEYFRAGYGNYCDAFDFHIYESPERVRRTIREYRELQEKYDVVKPLWSTELGLNSQGMTRLRVASEVYKKFATFFAAGGESVSWFGLLYPDAEGKALGTFGDAHNVFDSRYNRYNPRLDAVAYYHAVNSIAVKKFMEEKLYPNGIHAFRFLDSENRSLLVAWSEEERREVSVRLEGVREVKVIDIDGASFPLASTDGSYFLGINEPLLLLYRGDVSLPGELFDSEITLGEAFHTVARRGATRIPIVPGESLEFHLPPRWKVERHDDHVLIEAPSETKARELSVSLRSAEKGNVYLPIRIPISE